MFITIPVILLDNDPDEDDTLERLDLPRRGEVLTWSNILLNPEYVERINEPTFTEEILGFTVRSIIWMGNSDQSYKSWMSKDDIEHLIRKCPGKSAKELLAEAARAYIEEFQSRKILHYKKTGKEPETMTMRPEVESTLIFYFQGFITSENQVPSFMGVSYSVDPNQQTNFEVT